MKKSFYVTTPIYYPDSRLHIGHAYTTVAADALARYHRLLGDDVFFLTGTDEHGQKISKRAKEAGRTPQAYVDDIVVTIKELWKVLGISYDDFIRTTEPRHEKVVQEVFRRLQAKGDVFKGEYEGWYCTPCESFWTEAKLVDGKCPTCGRGVEKVKEESYFLRLSNYAGRLRQYILDNPDFIRPQSRRNEMLAFIDQGLEDLSISRTSFDWGVPLPGDPDHVAYVWIDALTNYITAAGFDQDQEKFERFWPANVHLVGKEIVRFHAIIWPIILMALDLPLPKTVFGHGWLLLGDAKISKSVGNVVDPTVLVKRYGLDPVRYYLLREIPFGSDGTYTEDALILRTNVDLANDLGNLLSRTTAMVGRFSQGLIPAPSGESGLRAVAQEAVKCVTARLEAYEISDALADLFVLIKRANKYIEDEAPWELSRKEDPRLSTVLYDLAESLRITAVALRPFLLDTPQKIYDQLGLGSIEGTTWADLAWGGLPPGTAVDRKDAIFPRIETAPREESSAEEPETPEAEEIDIDFFRRLDLRIAQVEAAEPVQGTDRLLKLSLKVGGKSRTVVSGIAQHYNPDDLVGKTVVLVANLKPAKLRGIESRGMILAAKDGGVLALLTADKDVGPGSPVS